jgi:glutathione S-transferase
MKLYGQPQSSCTRKVLMTLAEKGARAHFVAADAPFGEQPSPRHTELLRLPFGRSTVLEDGAFVLYEAPAIMRYLAAALPGPALTPSALPELARMEQWLSVESSYLGPAVGQMKAQLKLGPLYGVAPDFAAVEEARQEAGQLLDVIDRALAGSEYLVAAALSLADIALAASLHALFELRHGDLVRARPNVLSWWARVRSRPALRALLDARDELDLCGPRSASAAEAVARRARCRYQHASA